MEMQAEAERKRRAQVLESEGERQANINIADGKKSAVILASEAARMDQVNRAKGEAEAILAVAQATASGIAVVSKTLKESGGVEAASLRIAEQYIQAFSKIAKESTTMLLPSTAANPTSMMAQALGIYKSLIGNVSGGGLHEASHPTAAENSKGGSDRLPEISYPAATENFKDDASSSERSSTSIGDHSMPVFSLQSPTKREYN